MTGSSAQFEQSSWPFRKRRAIAGLCALAAVVLSGCGEKVYDTIELMPPPAVYVAGEVDPFPKVTSSSYQDQSTLFYATDRPPATAEDAPAFYANRRGFGLRAGTVEVRADPPFAGWDDIRQASLAPETSPRRELRISGVNEFGFLPVDQITFLPEQSTAEERSRAGKQFAAAVNRKLTSSVQNDIFIYVHGYNVDFDYPVLSAKELQHYLGYRGAFITYAWPATPNRFAYFKDLESADSTRKNSSSSCPTTRGRTTSISSAIAPDRGSPSRQSTTLCCSTRKDGPERRGWVS